MTLNEFKDKQLHISLMAGANQEYHQTRWYRFAWADRIFKIAVGVLAIAGLCLCVVTFFHPGVTWDAWSIAVAGSAAIVAIALNVIPVGEWSSDHRELFRRWTDLREEIDDLTFDLGDSLTPELEKRLRHLEAAVHRICGSETLASQKLFDRCWEKQKKSRIKVVVGLPTSPS